jgi:eukaryotic-like serine/threonine-protein kinase
MIGGSWNSRGVILFSLAPQNSRPDNAVLFTVSAAGGQPTPLTRLPKDGSEGGHYWPRFLPDGRRFLFAIFRQSMRQADLYVSSIDAPDERHHLLDNYSTASVVGDRLLYVTQGNTLMSQRLDLRRLRLEAETQAIVDGVQVWPVASRGLFSASDSGVIVYVPGRPANPYLQLTWMDRAGIVRRKLGEPARYGQLALSPDEKQVAVEIEMGEPPDHWDVWTFDVARGVPSRVTFGPANYRDPVWSPDGRELAYGVQQPNDMADLYRKSVGGTREEVPLVRDQTAKYPEQWLAGGVVYLTRA